MENTNIDINNTDKTKIINLENSKNTYSILFGALLVVIIVSVTIFFVQRNNSTKVVKDIKVSQSTVYDNTKDSTQELKDGYITNLNEYIANESDQNKKMSAVLKKSFIQTVSRNPDADLNAQERTESRMSVTRLYKYNVNKTEPVNIFLKNGAAFLPFFAFLENCFSQISIRGIDLGIRKNYFSHFSGWSAETANIEKDQKAAFEGFIKMSDDEEIFNLFKRDKSFNSYSAFAKAVYLDTYGKDMSKEEKDKIIKGVEKDIEEYNSGMYISVSSSSMRLTMLAPMHIGFSKYAIKNINGDTDYSDLENAYKEIEKVENDKVGRALVLSFLDTYIISAMGRDNSNKSSIDNKVARLKALLEENVLVKPLLKSNLNYGKTPSGEWFTFKQDFFKLSESNANLKNLLKEIGVDGY